MPYTLEIGETRIERLPTGEVAALKLVAEAVLTREQVKQRIQELKRQIDVLRVQLDIPKPSNAELIELGKQHYPYYTVDREAVRRRIDEIDAQISAIRALVGD